MKYLFTMVFFLFPLSKLCATEIKIYTWESYLSDSVISDFTKKTGHTVKQYFYDSEVDRNVLLTNGSADKYDLILVDNMNTLRYGNSQILQALASLKIENLENNGRKSREACGKYGIPYGKGTMGIAYRRSISKTAINSWQQLLTPPKEHIGTTMMIKDDVDTIAIALLARDLNPFTQNKKDLQVAHQLLQAQSKYLMEYGYPLSYTFKQGRNSNLTLASIYSGDLQNLKESTGQEDWEYVVPEEGTLFFVDCFTAPSGTIVNEASKAFLSFINEPQVAYKNAADIWFSTTNEAAQRIAEDSYKNDPELSPNQATLDRSYNYQQLSPSDLLIRNKINALLSIEK